MKLFELTESYQNILSLIDDDNADLDLNEALGTIEDAIEVKIVNIANLVKTLEAEAEVIKAEKKRLSQREKSRENHAEYLKRYMEIAMNYADMDEVVTPTRSVKIQNNKPSVYIFDEEKVPKEYKNHIPERWEVNKTILGDALKADKNIPGAELKIGRSIRIR